MKPWTSSCSTMSFNREEKLRESQSRSPKSEFRSPFAKDL